MWNNKESSLMSQVLALEKQLEESEREQSASKKAIENATLTLSDQKRKSVRTSLLFVVGYISYYKPLTLTLTLTFSIITARLGYKYLQNICFMLKRICHTVINPTLTLTLFVGPISIPIPISLSVGSAVYGYASAQVR